MSETAARRVQRQRPAAVPHLRADRRQRGKLLFGIEADAVVARQHQNRHADARGRVGVEQELRGDAPVQPHLVKAGVHCVRERRAARARGGMESREHYARKAPVQSGQHAVRVARPAPVDARLLGQQLGQQIARAVMRVPHDDAVEPGLQRAAADGGHLFGSSVCGGFALRRTRLGFRPVGDPAAALDVRTDKQLHSKTPFDQRKRRSG